MYDCRLIVCFGDRGPALGYFEFERAAEVLQHVDEARQLCISYPRNMAYRKKPMMLVSSLLAVPGAICFGLYELVSRFEMFQ